MLALSAHAAASPASAAPSPRFEIAEYRVLGNSALPALVIEQAVYPYLGPNKSFDDVQKARDALQLAYRQRDFGTVFVDIPEQDVGDGIVRLRVTEGRLRVVTATGAKYFSERKLVAALPAAEVGSVPKLGELQRQLAAVNSETADRSVVPVLKAGPVQGTVDLALKVDDRLPFHGSAELNNQYTVGTTHLRASVSAEYGNLFGDLGDLSFQYQTSPEETSQVGVFAGSYTSGPFADGLRASLLYINSSSSVPTVGALGVLGKGDIISGRLTLPLAFTGLTTQSAYVGADYKHFRESISIDPATALTTPITYMDFSVGYSGSWRTDSRMWSLESSANFGIRGLLNDPESFESKRYLARPNYFYLREDGGVTQLLPRGFDIRLRIAGQYTASPLISNENSSIAGSDGVRGYLESEELGDIIVKGTLQIDSRLLTWQKLSGRMFVFYDAGRTRTLDALPEQPDHAILKSAGAGISLADGALFQSTLTWAYPLSSSVSTRSGESRLLFILRAAF